MLPDNARTVSSEFPACADAANLPKPPHGLSVKLGT